MTKQERDELDAKVLAAVAAGNNRLVKVAKACGIQGLAAISNDHPQTRAVDRSLQRLRNAGKITYDSTPGWKVV